MLKPAIATMGYVFDNNHWRAFSMTAGLFEKYCDQHGLQCMGQELVNWGARRMIDCFSVFTGKGSVWARPNRVMRNPDFTKEGRDQEMATVPIDVQRREGVETAPPAAPDQAIARTA